MISGKLAKDLFEIVWTEGGDPAKIVEARGMKQVTDTGAIEKAVDEIIAANPDKVEQAQAKPTMLGWFVGQVMKATGGKANPQAVNEILKSETRNLSSRVFSRFETSISLARRIFCGAFSLSTKFFFCSRNFVGDAFCLTRVLSKCATFVARDECARVER